MELTTVDLGGSADGPLLVVGPSLGTSVEALWGGVAADLASDVRVLGWELPGHGRDRGTPPRDLTIGDLAAAVLAAVDAAAGPGTRFHHAGDSVGGAVGLQLALDAPDRVLSSAVLCSGARIGSPEVWEQRLRDLAAGGTEGLREASRGRWFGSGFDDDAVAQTLLDSLAAADDEGYAAVCGALRDFDVRERLGSVTAPVLAVAGADDAVTPTVGLREVADGVQDGRLVVLPGVAHLAPAEAPSEVAVLLRGQVLGRHAAGMQVRRQVLGDAHVDRAVAATTDLTADFQRLITEYAWGSIWTRPGLDRRSRSLITLTAMVARGHHEELAMHVRAALRNGLTVQEIEELLLQTAIYCGVPDANTAFRIAQRVLSEDG